MTKKIEIDDAMVARFSKASQCYGGHAGDIRRGLDAALNPEPAEPVDVTDEMLAAGQREFDNYRRYHIEQPNDWWTRLYRAMYRARPIKTGPLPQSPEPWRQHRRFNDPMDGSRFVNRRKDNT